MRQLSIISHDKMEKTNSQDIESSYMDHESNPNYDSSPCNTADFLTIGQIAPTIPENDLLLSNSSNDTIPPASSTTIILPSSVRNQINLSTTTTDSINDNSVKQKLNNETNNKINLNENSTSPISDNEKSCFITSFKANEKSDNNNNNNDEQELNCVRL